MNPKPAILLKIGLAGLLIAVVFVAHNLAPSSQDSPLISSFLDGLHAPGFALLTLMAAFLVYPRSDSPPTLAVMTVAVVGLAVIAEASQFFGPRDASMKDLAVDLLGIALALTALLLLLPTVRQSLSKWQKIAALTVVVCGGAALSYAPITIGYAIYKQRAAFPSLADFEADWQLLLITKRNAGFLEVISTPLDWPVGGARSAIVTFGDGETRGLELGTLPNWSNYDRLSFVAASVDQEPIRLTIRVHDTEHTNEYGDRFNAELLITNSPTRFEISVSEIESAPDSRLMSMDSVESIIFFVPDVQGKSRMIIDEIRLTAGR